MTEVRETKLAPPKPLTEAETLEAQRLLKLVLDSGGEVLLPPGQWLLLGRYAATREMPMPEDVARKMESFAAYHDEHAGYGGAGWEFHARASTFIRDAASAAARVPGLESELAQRTRERDSEMEERWKCAEVRRALESRAESAESERAAALKREEAVSDHLQTMGVSSMATLADDFVRLQKERDAALRERDGRVHRDEHLLAQQRLTASEALLEEHRAALRRLDALLCFRTKWRKGDAGVENPAGIDSAFSTFRRLLGWMGVEVVDSEPLPPTADVDTLTARVAELERALSETMESDRDVRKLYAAMLARATTAESKATALEAWQSDMLHVLGQGLDYTPTADNAAGILKGLIFEAKEMEQRLVTTEAERDALHEQAATLGAQLAELRQEHAEDVKALTAHAAHVTTVATVLGVVSAFQEVEAAVVRLKEREAQGQADHRAIHEALGWAHSWVGMPLPAPWRGVTVLVEERAAARASLATLLHEVESVLATIPKAVRVREGGGPENIAASLAVSVAKVCEELKDTAAAWHRETARADAMTARVTELEREKKALEDGIQPMRDTRRLMGADLAAAEARATAAEAKVAEFRVSLEDMAGLGASFAAKTRETADFLLRAQCGQPTPALRLREAVAKAVDSIVSDLNDRRGFKNEWRRTDPEIQQVIREAWAGIILAACDGTASGETEAKAAKWDAAEQRWEDGDFVGWQPGRAIHYILTGADRGPPLEDTPQAVNAASPALKACHPVPTPGRMRLALDGAHLVLDGVEPVERARWAAVLAMLEAATRPQSTNAERPEPVAVRPPVPMLWPERPEPHTPDEDDMDAARAHAEAVTKPPQSLAPVEVRWQGTDEAGDAVRVLEGGALQWESSPAVWTSGPSATFSPLEEGLAVALDAQHRAREADTARAAAALVGVAKESAHLGAEDMRRRMMRVLSRHWMQAGSVAIRMAISDAETEMDKLPTLDMESPAHG